MDSRNLPYRFALTQVILCVDFDPPVELDEVETRCYGSESLDFLTRAFQQIILSSPQLSPGELSQRALDESMGFITSTLQRCRDLHGHTPSLSREARTHQFLERVQSLSLQAPQDQTWASNTSTDRIMAPHNHLNPRYSPQSNDSGIASLAESDIDLSTPWKPVQGFSSLGKVSSLPFSWVKPMALSKAQDDEFDMANFDTHVSTSFESHGLSLNQPGPSVESLRPTTEFNKIPTTHCVCGGVCSWCHTTECKPSETSARQWPETHSSSLRVSGIGVDEYPCGETCEGEDPAAWRTCRALCDVQQEDCDQQGHDHILSHVIPETPSTQASPPDSHFASAKDDYHSTEEDIEFQYEQLVENITNLVLKSKWVAHIEDDCMPIVRFTHVYLESIRSHDDDLYITRKLPVSLTSPCTDGEDIGSNIDGQEAARVLSANGKRKQGAGHGRHRKRDDNDDQYPNGDGPDDFDDPDGWSGDRKRVRIDDFQKFPCPYRKRYPTKFNVREHHQCALNTFASMALLK